MLFSNKPVFCIIFTSKETWRTSSHPSKNGTQMSWADTLLFFQFSRKKCIRLIDNDSAIIWRKGNCTASKHRSYWDFISWSQVSKEKWQVSVVTIFKEGLPKTTWAFPRLWCLQDTLSHLILIRTLWGQYYQPHFRDETAEAVRGCILPKLHKE